MKIPHPTHEAERIEYGTKANYEGKLCEAVEVDKTLAAAAADLEKVTGCDCSIETLAEPWLEGEIKVEVTIVVVVISESVQVAGVIDDILQRLEELTERGHRH